METESDVASGTLPGNGDRVDVRAVFQPIVELDTGAVVGYEALARGPAGTSTESPLALFAAARDAGRLPELELTCQRAALKAVKAAGWGGPAALFLNVEPEVIGSTTRPEQQELLAQACRDGTVVIELTERALTENPAQLLRGVDRLREIGCLIALDDVGADDRSLALMAFLRPDIIKLDLRLVQERPSGQIAEVVHAVMAEAERSGAQIVAEGIETDAHLESALAFGATHGQGYRFGRPGPIDPDWTIGELGLTVRRPDRAPPPTPFDFILAAGQPIRRARKQMLVQIAKQLERRAVTIGRQAVLLATFEHARHFSDAARERYEHAAAATAFVAVFAEGIAPHPGKGVLGQAIGADEPLRTRWDVAVVSPHFAAVMVSRDLGDNAPDPDRRFDYALVHDRELAVAAARLLMARVEPR